MAVYTKVSSDDLQKFLKSYTIGALVSFEGIEEGVSNTNYFVTTDQTKFVLTLFEPHRVEPQDIPSFLNYAIALEQAGIPCPKTIPQKDGSYLSILNARPAALFSVLSGEGGSPAMLTPALCAEGGKMLGRMHLVGQKYDGATDNHFSLSRWKIWAENLPQDIRGELSFIEKNWPRALPMGAIHADYFPDNVFFRDGKISGVFDFHFVCRDFLVYDLAIALNAWVFDENNKFQQDRYDGFLNGYELLRPLSEDEKQSLPLMLRAAALRFYLSRMEEKKNWKEGDFMKPHDPEVFAKRLAHFQKETR